MDSHLASLVSYVTLLNEQTGNKRTLNNYTDILEILKNDKTVLIWSLLHFYKKGLAEYQETVKALVKSCNSLSKNIDFAFEVLKFDYSLISIFPKISTNYRVKSVKLLESPQDFQLYTDWHNEKKALLAVHFNPVVYRYLPNFLKHNETIIKEVLKSSVLHPEKLNDKANGLFFDLPEKYQNNKLMISLALKTHPSIFKSLPEQYRKDSDIILKALTKGFYENNASEFYELQNIIPFIDTEFYNDIKNIKWMMVGFENNVVESELYTNCAMLIFCNFMRESSKKHNVLKDFFNMAGITDRFESMLAKHHFKLYSDDVVPTGIEPEANLFFKEVWPQLSLKFERFILQSQLAENLSINEFEKSSRGKI